MLSRGLHFASESTRTSCVDRLTVVSGRLTLSNPLTWTEPREVKRSALASPGPGCARPSVVNDPILYAHSGTEPQ